MNSETREGISNFELFLLTVDQITEKQQVSGHNSILEKLPQLKKNDYIRSILVVVYLITDQWK